MPRNKLLTIILLFAASFSSPAQVKDDFKAASDSLAVLLKERTGVSSTVPLDKVMKRGKKLDLYFKRELSDYPWRPADMKWFRAQVAALFPDVWAGWELGEIWCRRTPLSELAMEKAGNDGCSIRTRFAKQPSDAGVLVRRSGSHSYDKGMSGRHIALWQSHGRYFDEKSGRWLWQRAQLWRTCEDMYTQSYVLPFLVPMLERAGAVVMTPRERDTQRDEVVCDNDPAFKGGNALKTRRLGKCIPSGKWEDAGTGFADTKEFYLMDENPFTAGSALKADCTSSSSPGARMRWSAEFPSRGSYAVYVSYKTLPESSACARYTVEHLGGSTEFTVNQKMGGGTWIYLGTFDFSGSGAVILDNSTPKGCKYEKGSVVTADAVRFGGGYGKVIRGTDATDKSLWRTSGLPAYMEGALYSMRWAGVEPKVYEEWERDYVRDYASRGAWVKWLKDDKGIPFDMSLAFHTDAGVTPDDSIVGTLSIYTLMADGHRTNTDGTDRMSCRLLADRVQSQIALDLRSQWNPEWSRRQLWDRSYSESRTTDVPGMLLELLSHQNFADMKFGLDPAFRFTVCRSVYKGMLKFLSDLYDRPYCVQPLPVSAFSALLSGDGKAVLDWQPTPDPLEPTAAPKSYIVYTRIDDGAFDEGTRVRANHFETALKAGHIYSFKVEAENDGGRSFPSETLCAGIPGGSSEGAAVLVVNNFTRVSGPTWFDTPSYAGFDGSLDGGVPWGCDLSYIGESYQARRELGWASDWNPGFGATSFDYDGLPPAGNTFDFVIEHGRALMALGRPFCSQGRDAFSESSRHWDTVDLLCGKQVRTPLGGASFEVFPAKLQDALRAHSSAGGNLIISGANIATDIWDRIYPVEVDSLRREAGMAFAREVLGYEYVSSFGARNGSVLLPGGAAQLWHSPNGTHYHVERCDAIAPAGGRGTVLAEYPGSGAPAAIKTRIREGGRNVCFGFPLEALTDASAMQELIRISLDYFNEQ